MLDVTNHVWCQDYVNFLLVMVPVGIVAGAMNWNSTAVFTINFFAIIPLAAVLSFATEEISIKLGETMGGLLNATFGNAVELIVCYWLSVALKLATFQSRLTARSPLPFRSVSLL